MRVVDLTNLVATAPAITTVTVARDVTPPEIVSLGAYKRRLQWNVVDTETPYITLVVKLRSGGRYGSSGCR